MFRRIIHFSSSDIEAVEIVVPLVSLDKVKMKETEEKIL
jgi:hypothetical protein